MDSLLSNAQRCARKADSLVKYGLYDEALVQLDKSIVYLNELKSLSTRYETIQMLNVQIDSIDRKMRSVAIKRSESIKKKNRIESLINNKNYQSVLIDHNQIMMPSMSDAVMTSSNCSIDSTSSCSSSSVAYKRGLKLDKDEKSIIEELSTTNAEYKNINIFLINEIEQLKRENDYLKVELLKMHMSDSLNTNVDPDNIENIENIMFDNTTVLNNGACSKTTIKDQSSSPKSLKDNSNSINSNNENAGGKSGSISTSTSSSNNNSNSTSSSLSCSSNTKSNVEQNDDYRSSPLQICNNKKNRQIDLSKYLDNDDDDDDDDEDEDDDLFPNNHTDLDESSDFSSIQNITTNSSNLSSNTNKSLPPQEFIID